MQRRAGRERCRESWKDPVVWGDQKSRRSGDERRCERCEDVNGAGYGLWMEVRDENAMSDGNPQTGDNRSGFDCERSEPTRQDAHDPSVGLFVVARLTRGTFLWQAKCMSTKLV